MKVKNEDEDEYEGKGEGKGEDEDDEYEYEAEYDAPYQPLRLQPPQNHDEAQARLEQSIWLLWNQALTTGRGTNEFMDSLRRMLAGDKYRELACRLIQDAPDDAWNDVLVPAEYYRRCTSPSQN